MATPENPDSPHSDTTRVAEVLHKTRQRLGRPGDAASDWQQAEKIVQSPLRTALFKLNQSLLKLRPPTRRAMAFVGRDIPRWIFVSLPQVEMVKLVALPLILAGATSIITRQLQWEVNQTATLDGYFDHLEKLTFSHGFLNDEPDKGAIVLARGRTIATLRKLDLERKQQLLAFLQASDLVRIDREGNRPPVISFAKANLADMDLRFVDLRSADLSNADLSNVDSSGAGLAGANLSWAWLEGATFSETGLADANLSDANLSGVDWSGTAVGLARTNLSGARLEGADLSGAWLYAVNLSGARLEGADLSEAVLYEVNLSGADLTEEQLRESRLCKTILPSGMELDPNRDCESFEQYE